MNLFVKLENFNSQCILFSHLKKNIIIDGIFSKILYLDTNTTFNGIYLNFNIIPYYSYKQFDDINTLFLKTNNFYNNNIVQKLIQIEEEILMYYNDIFKTNKKVVHSLKTQLNTGNLKIHNTHETTILEGVKCGFLLKIAGVWETTHNIGITYKITLAN